MDGFGKIAFGVRCAKPDPLFFLSWTTLLCAGTDNGGLRPGDRVLVPSVEMPHQWAANTLVWQFLNRTDCDTLMMFDDDMEFQPAHVAALRDHAENWDFGMVQALCCCRKPPHVPLMIVPTPDGGTVEQAPDKDTKTAEVAFAGLAFTLIRREVFDAVQANLEAPGLYFAWGNDGLGEDVTFCQAAQRAGYKVGVDARVAIGHRATVGIEFDVSMGKATMHAYQNPGLRELIAAVNEHKQKKE